MIFQLGKLKSTVEKNMGEKNMDGGKAGGESSLGGDTFKRWRDAAARIQGNALPSLSENAYEAAEAETALDMELDPREFGMESFEMGSQFGRAEQQLLEVELDPALVRGKSAGQVGQGSALRGSGVQWPDPRAAIALTKEISDTDGAEKLYGPEIEGVRVISSPKVVSSKGTPPPSSPTQTALHSQPTAAPASSPLAQVAASTVASVFSGLGFGGEKAQGADRVSALRSASTARPTPVAVSSASSSGSVVTQHAAISGASGTGSNQSAGVLSGSADRSMGTPSMLAKNVSMKDAPISLEEELRRRFGCNVKSALGPGTIIEGNFSFDSPVCIDGTLIGEVHSSSVLIVGENATVNAKISVGSLIVLGNVTGMVEAKDLVEIRAGGSLEGDIDTERVAIEEGGWFQGRCNPRITRKKEQ